MVIPGGHLNLEPLLRVELRTAFNLLYGEFDDGGAAGRVVLGLVLSVRVRITTTPLGQLGRIH